MLSDKVQNALKGRVGRIVMFTILLLIAVPFIFTGIERYTPNASTTAVAEVGNQKISVNQYDEALKSEQARLRAAGERDPKKLNGKELKTRLLDQLIREQLVLQQASKLGYTVDQGAMISVIEADPKFQENGKFSDKLFQGFLQYNHMNSKQYIGALAQNRMLRELLTYQADTSILPRAVVNHLADVLAQQREVAKSVLRAAEYAALAKPDAQMIQSYYTAHPELSQLAEQARVQYIVFSPETLLPAMQVSDAAAQAYFDAHKDQFAPPEKRDIAHILIRALPDATPAQRQAALAKAQQVLALAQKTPQDFAALAKQYSQDPLTAMQGGSFGAIARGTIFKQVEDTAFAMAPGEIRGPVASPAGYHIVYLKKVIGGGSANFTEVKAKVIEAAQRDLAMRKFNEAVDTFGDAVYGKPDSLQYAADQYHLPIQTSDWFSRSGPPQGLLKNERLLNAIFANDSVQGKRNTEPIEVAPNTLVAARIVDYKPATNKPLEAVRGEIEARLRLEQAGQLAAKQGEADLAALKQGKSVALKFDTPVLMDREQALKAGTDQKSLQAIYRVATQSLPAYAGFAAANGDYIIYKIFAVKENDALRTQAQQILPQSLGRVQAEALALAYIDSLRSTFKVKIKQDVLDKIGDDKS